MESSEMSLIEISGEDDSLLLQSPAGDFSSFGVSPLQIPRSSGTKEADSRIFGSASSHGNKENLSTNDNKSGIRNLSVERQKMKKNRKTGIYNLRKSLAWDRAFLTEEGVLNPVELSMIARIGHGDSLSVIDEERRDSLTLNSDVVSDSASMETFEENLSKELPSGQPRKRDMGGSVLKRDSVSGSRPPMASRSSQKIPTGRGLNKSASKGSVCSTPMASPSQKRLLSTVTSKVMTRNSKIPRVPLSKHPPSPAKTSMPARSGGSHLKSSGIAQPAAQKNISLKLPSNMKQTSKAINISSGGASKSLKQLGMTTREDSGAPAKKCSSLEMDSSANHNARNTNKVRNCPQKSSNHSLPNKMVESVDGTRTRISSHLQSDNGGGNRKVVQVQGIKPSGLRMPSPSMKFFSEVNMKPSNLKSSMPTSRNSAAADHSADFKRIKAQHEALNHNALSTTRLASQVTKTCSTALPVNFTAQAEATYEKCSQQVVKQRCSIEDKVPQPTNNISTENVVTDIDCHQNNEIPTSSNDEEKVMKCNVTFSHTESVDIKCRDPAFRQNEYVGGDMMETSLESCPEVQVNVVYAIKEVCPTLTEETGCTSSDSKLLESETDLKSDHDNLTLVADSDPSIGMCCDDKTPGEGKINDLQGPNNGESMKMQHGSNLLVVVDGKCLPEMDGSDYTNLVCVGKPVDVESSAGGKQDSFSDDVQMNSCTAKCGIVGEDTNEHDDKDQGYVIFDSELSTMKLGECSLEHDNLSCGHGTYHEDCNLFYEDKSSSMSPERYDSKEISDVVSVLREPELQGGSDHSRTSFLEPSENPAAQCSDVPFSPHGAEELPLSCGDDIVDIGCQHALSVASNNGTEVTITTNVEVAQQVLSDDMAVQLPIVERYNTDLINDVLPKDSSLHRDPDSNTESFNDIDEVHSSVAEVKFRTDLEVQSCSSRSNNQATRVEADPVSEASVCPNIRHDLSPNEALLSATLDIKYDKPDYSASSEEPEAKTSQVIDSSTVETQFNLEGIGCRHEENGNLKRLVEQKVVIPVSNAVPFSDEWLAALESAGEEILTMKSGAVQHSPPDKSVPESSPWSPVKRKTNQVIGPFDCTKYTNTQPDQPE